MVPLWLWWMDPGVPIQVAISRWEVALRGLCSSLPFGGDVKAADGPFEVRPGPGSPLPIAADCAFDNESFRTST
jgi:hypothetical protein